MDRKYYFQATPKLVTFSKDETSVLLARRKGENDYDGVFSFIGGKIETTDKDLVAGIQREKNEEVGESFKAELYPDFNFMFRFPKKDGNILLVPHFYCRYLGGEVLLNEEEYSEFCWVKLDELDGFEPKIPNIAEVTRKVLQMKNKIATNEDFFII